MIVETLLGQKFPPVTAAAYAIANDARAASGTDMGILGKALERDFNLRRTTTNDMNVMVGMVKEGALAVINVGGNRGSYKGVFSDGGHYIIALGVADDGRLILADPYLYSGKYDTDRRAARVKVVDDLVYAAPETAHIDADNRNPRYTIFARGD